ncbi:PIN domain-containing protein [Methylobacterium segetis]|uniref:PIN domain-containing protein n=1 Tax=Methylobacterium segetis TaxID=2488750 RepID=UPI001050FF3B|nr:tetratricopeptide repeat protein [Methylobacterium segetis]
MLAERMGVGALAGLPIIAPSDGPPSSDPLEHWLDKQIDRLRDRARGIDPAEALREFQQLLEDLPPTASGTIRFRVKANIGHRYLALDDGESASKWLLDAFDEAPMDQRAVANRALAYFVRGEVRAAYDYGAEALTQDATNKTLASYLPQFAVLLSEIERPLADIPESLRGCEEVAVAEIAFYRGREAGSIWWDLARRGADLFPNSKHMDFVRALADLDEISRDDRVQRTHLTSEDQRRRLQSAAEVFDAYWMERRTSLGSRFDDGVQGLVGAMMAYHIVHDTAKALERATLIADAGLVEHSVLHNAVLVALANGDMKLGRRLIDLSPDDPDLAFHAGYLDVQDGRWDVAAERFAGANVPDFERAVVDAVCRLAAVKAGSPDAPALADIMEDFSASPRALVLISRVATEKGQIEIARQAYLKALACIDDDTHLAGRLMVAGVAWDIGKPSEVVDLLDGHLPVRGYERENVRLAAAHANERPHRPRNLRFFANLPAEIRSRPEIARAHASVLLDVNEVSEALALLRRLHAADVHDSYVTLRLVEAMRRSGQVKAARKLVRSASLTRREGAPEHAMMLIAQAAAAGNRDGAYAAAYDLVRKHPDRPEIAMSYVGLGFVRNGGGPGVRRKEAGEGAFVVLEGPMGASRSFAIDDGPEFYGIPVETPGSPIAKLVAGKRRGDTFEIPKMGAEPETWKVAAVHGKYLQLHQRILEEFEIRYPGAPGLSRLAMKEGDVTEALAMVRRSAERNARTAKLYIDNKMPLAVVARVLGGDPIGFAQYVRALGADVATCAGIGEEMEGACVTALLARGRGAALDPYTAWVAAEMELLSTLKSWFGKLHVPRSCIWMIERMIEKQRQGIGRRQMTMSWHEGQFYRQETDDAFLRSQIAVLEAGRDKIVEACEIHSVMVPDTTSEVADVILETTGASFLDAAFLAQELTVPLLSDDAYYRAWGKAATGCEGLWIQAVLMTAADEGTLPVADNAKALVGLAARQHSFVSLNGEVLYEICRQDDDHLYRLKAALRYIGGSGADMVSHFRVVVAFLTAVWDDDSDVPMLRRKTATGLVFEALLRNRRGDWLAWLRRLIHFAPATFACRRYLNDWLRGHFVPVEPRLTGSKA